MRFINALAPTEDELREWAKNPNAAYPDEMPQDWDLVITDFETAGSLLRLANEDSPNRKFFLGCLYLLAGDCVRGGVDEPSVKKLKQILNKVDEKSKSDLQLWVKRTLLLLEKPEIFVYEDWCCGDLAHIDEK